MDGIIDRCLLLNETSLDPVHNLAVESALLDKAADGTCVLYLWQNQKSVVIGRNQDAWQECRIAELTADQGMLVRRPTGGGAVFHDLGNLNFSFILPQVDYDVARQLSVILRALESFGLHAEKNGRNDITLDGRKLSGNAFLARKGRALHHGTLLVQVDLADLARYLKPSGLKLQSNKIASVRSRVVNLRDANQTISIHSLRAAVTSALERVYGAAAEEIFLGTEDPVYRFYERKYRSSEWILGKTNAFDRVVYDRFSWGEARLGLTLWNGRVADAALFTDSPDTSLPAAVRKAFLGMEFTKGKLAQLRASGIQPIADLAGLFMLYFTGTTLAAAAKE